MRFERPDTPSSQTGRAESSFVPPTDHEESARSFSDRHQHWLSRAMEKAYPPVGVTLAMTCTTLGLRAYAMGMEFERHAFGAASVVLALSSLIVSINRLFKEKKSPYDRP